LAAAVGAASARLVVTSVLKGSGMEVGEVVAVLDEAGQELRFNREILSNTLENIDQGVSVVDGDMCLVAWNRRYQQLFDYPDGMLYIGRPVADLIRYNAERGELGRLSPEEIEAEVDKRIGYMRAGSAHVSERVRASGQVLELRGQPLPGGGYATSYSDVTDYKRVERELREINEHLEQRVAERTREAETAQESRSRFLTAVSHDVLQPLNAARLFTSALRESADPQEQRSEEHTSELQSREKLVCRLLLEKSFAPTRCLLFPYTTLFRSELREINEHLEQRVAERTREAETAQESRSRFLTAVSHDVLQPLNAARLFTSALRESADPQEQ